MVAQHVNKALKWQVGEPHVQHKFQALCIKQIKEHLRSWKRAKAPCFSSIDNTQSDIMHFKVF